MLVSCIHNEGKGVNVLAYSHEGQEPHTALHQDFLFILVMNQMSDHYYWIFCGTLKCKLIKRRRDRCRIVEFLSTHLHLPRVLRPGLHLLSKAVSRRPGRRALALSLLCISHTAGCSGSKGYCPITGMLRPHQQTYVTELVPKFHCTNPYGKCSTKGEWCETQIFILLSASTPRVKYIQFRI